VQALSAFEITPTKTSIHQKNFDLLISKLKSLFKLISFYLGLSSPKPTMLQLRPRLKGSDGRLVLSLGNYSKKL
jgi:hypothetical protein